MSSMRLFLTQTIKMSLITRQAPTLPVPSHTPRSHLPKTAATRHPQARCPLAPFLPTEHVLSLTCPYQLSAPLRTPQSKNRREHTSRSYPRGPFHQGCPLARFHSSHALPQAGRAEGRLPGGPTAAAARCPGRGLAPTVTPRQHHMCNTVRSFLPALKSSDEARTHLSQKRNEAMPPQI